MANDSADQFFSKHTRSQRSSNDAIRGRSSKARKPSSAGYMIVALVAVVGLFFGLWWLLVSGGDEAPWLPAGLASSVVLLVALSAREVVMRRAWTRYLLEQGANETTRPDTAGKSQRHKGSRSTQHAALRTIQKLAAKAEQPGSAPEAHLEVFHLCQEYLASIDETSGSAGLNREVNTMRVGQERIRTLQKHHLLTWVKGTTRVLTREAQRRARTSDKIETANRALECLESALKIYPSDPELNESKLAIREFSASVKVAHWVELAERSAFKGHYKRAIERYQDALFYLTRETVKEEVKAAGLERIGREIDLLRAKLRSRNGDSSNRKGNTEDQ